MEITVKDLKHYDVITRYDYKRAFYTIANEMGLPFLKVTPDQTPPDSLKSRVFNPDGTSTVAFTDKPTINKSYTKQVIRELNKRLHTTAQTLPNVIGISGDAIYTSDKPDMSLEQTYHIKTRYNFKPRTIDELTQLDYILRPDTEEEKPDEYVAVELLTPEDVGLTQDEMRVNKDIYFIDGETTIDYVGDDPIVRVWSYMYVNGDMTEQRYFDGNAVDMVNEMTNIVHRNPEATFKFHNIKFDGSYLTCALDEMGFTPNYNEDIKPTDMPDKSYRHFVTASGWFIVQFKYRGVLVKSTDTLKIINMPVASMAKTIGAPQGKGLIDYTKPRPEGYVSDDVERSYGMQDVIIPALTYYKLVTEQGLEKGTSAGNAIEEVENMDDDFKEHFIGQLSAPQEDLLELAYRGGYVYVNPKYINKKVKGVKVYDSNSAYPYAMVEAKLPYGELETVKGVVPESDDTYNWYTIQLRGQLKKNHIPTVQFQTNRRKFNEMNPDFWSKHPDHQGRAYARVFKNDTIVVTEVDLELIKLNYDLTKLTIKQTHTCQAKTGLFKDFVLKHIKAKEEASRTGNAGLRYVSKLFLNSAYGKFGTSRVSDVIEISVVNGIVTNNTVSSLQDTYHMGVASAITAFVRNNTIRFALALGDKYVYSDTDSCHALGEVDPELAKKYGVVLDEYQLGAWKDETDTGHGDIFRGKYLGAKKYYLEYEDKKDDGTHYTKTAGAGITSGMWKYVTHENFKEGLTIPAKLASKQVRGGLALIETTFTIGFTGSEGEQKRFAKEYAHG